MHTGDRNGAGTNAKVHVTLYGENGNSEKLQLVNDLAGSGNLFEKGDIDVFSFTFRSLGRLLSIQIGHDDSGNFADWDLHDVTVTYVALDMKYVFDCQCWLNTQNPSAIISGKPG